MTEWNTLPLELLKLIFSYLEEKTDGDANLQQCSLTCRIWRIPAQKIIFSKIVLNSLHDVSTFINLLTDKNTEHLGNSVKKLNYDPLIRPVETQEEESTSLSVLLNLLPYLEELNTTASIIFYQLFLRGMLPNLNILPKPNNEQEDDLYLNCLPLIKNRLKRIDISYYEKLEIDTTTKIKHMLHQFKNLEYVVLTLRFHTLLGSLNYLESTYKDLSHPLLVRINFDWLHGSVTNDNTLQPYYNVKDLQIESHYVEACFNNSDYMSYIEKMFPNLDRLFISIYEPFVSTRRIISVPSFDATLQFLNYVFKIPDFLVEDIISNQNTLKIITAIHCLESKPFCLLPRSLILTYTENGAFFDSKMEAIGFSYNKQQYYFKTKVICVGGGNKCSSLFELIKTTGKFYRRIELDGIPNENGISILEYITEYCTKLETLIIRNNTSLEELSQSKNRSLKSLELSSYMLRSSHLSYLELCFPKLESMTIRKCGLERNMKINMPNSSFQSLKLVISIDTFYKFLRVMVEVVTEVAPTQYYCLAVETLNVYGNSTSSRMAGRRVVRVENQTKEDFITHGVGNPCCAAYFIRCKSINNFLLTTPSLKLINE